jgi:hypothetical protein
MLLRRRAHERASKAESGTFAHDIDFLHAYQDGTEEAEAEVTKEAKANKYGGAGDERLRRRGLGHKRDGRRTSSVGTGKGGARRWKEVKGETGGRMHTRAFAEKAFYVVLKLVGFKGSAVQAAVDVLSCARAECKLRPLRCVWACARCDAFD